MSNTNHSSVTLDVITAHHAQGDLSPVSVPPIGSITMDIGSSPPPVSSYDGEHHDVQPTDLTTQLSDLSGEMNTTIEDRLDYLEHDGSATALTTTAAKSEALVAPPRARSGVSPVNQTTTPTEQLPPQVPVATKTISLLAFKKPKPLVTVAIEVADGVVEQVVLYEGDNSTKCRERAQQIIDKHALDVEGALELLTENLLDTLEQYQPGTIQPHGTSTHSRPTAQEQRAAEAAAPPPAQRAGPSSSSSSYQQTRQPHQHRNAAAATSNSSVPRKSPVRSSKSPMPVRRELSSRTPLADARGGSSDALEKMDGEDRDHSPEVYSRQTSAQRSYARIAPRYLSPQPQRQPPPEPTYSHAPQLCANTRKIFERSGSHMPAHERLHLVNLDQQQKRRSRELQMQEEEKKQATRSFSNHKVRGLDWQLGYQFAEHPAGYRLHEQAMRQLKRQEEKAAAIQAERRRREVDGASFQPAINRDSMHYGGSRYHDPYYYSSLSKKQTSTYRPMSTEERQLQECTFHPKINNTTSDTHVVVGNGRASSLATPSANSSNIGVPPSTNRASQLRASSRSPVRPQTTSSASAVSQSRVSPTRPSTAATSALGSQPRVSPVRPSTDRRVSPVRPQTASTSTLSERLYNEARERNERLEEAKRKADSIDPKTGRPLYRPYTGRKRDLPLM